MSANTFNNVSTFKVDGVLFDMVSCCRRLSWGLADARRLRRTAPSPTPSPLSKPPGQPRPTNSVSIPWQSSRPLTDEEPATTSKSSSRNSSSSTSLRRWTVSHLPMNFCLIPVADTKCLRFRTIHPCLRRYSSPVTTQLGRLVAQTLLQLAEIFRYRDHHQHVFHHAHDAQRLAGSFSSIERRRL